MMPKLLEVLELNGASYHGSCNSLGTTKVIWEYLNLLFSGKSDITRINDLYQEFFQIQQDGRTATDYFCSLKGV